jgi:hypothetical protein
MLERPAAVANPRRLAAVVWSMYEHPADAWTDPAGLVGVDVALGTVVGVAELVALEAATGVLAVELAPEQAVRPRAAASRVTARTGRLSLTANS